MTSLTINGIGPVGAFGAGLADFKDALPGNRKIRPEITRVTTRNGDCDLPVFRTDTKALADFINLRKLRRLDNFSRMALLGAVLAVADSAQPLNGSRTGLIVASAHGASATTFAFLDSVIDNGDALASPTLFSNSVHNAAAAHIAEHFQITGPTLSLAQGLNSLTMALLTAAQWLDRGPIDTVLCGVIDCYCEVLGYCRQSYNEAQQNPETKSFSGLGEGALFLHLSRVRNDDPKPKHGYLNKIELNLTAPAAGLPFISSTSACHRQACAERKTKIAAAANRLPIDLLPICGELPIPTSFDPAAAAVLLEDRSLFSHYIRLEKFTGLNFANTAIGCWQPMAAKPQKPLTGNCYWITNHADFDFAAVTIQPNPGSGAVFLR